MRLPTSFTPDHCDSDSPWTKRENLCVADYDDILIELAGNIFVSNCKHKPKSKQEHVVSDSIQLDLFNCNFIVINEYWKFSYYIKNSGDESKITKLQFFAFKDIIRPLI